MSKKPCSFIKLLQHTIHKYNTEKFLHVIFTELQNRKLIKAFKIFTGKKQLKDFTYSDITFAIKLLQLKITTANAYFDTSTLEPFSNKCIFKDEKFILEQFFTTEFYIEEVSNTQDVIINSLNLSPKKEANDLFKLLKQTVIGQDEALKDLILIIFNLKILMDLAKNTNKITTTKNIPFIYGPSGCGKTYIIQEIVNKLDIEYIEFDASAITSNGYIGMDVDDVADRILEKQQELGDDNIPIICFLDEIDKLTHSAAGQNNDIGTTGAQRNLLKLLESNSFDISARKERESNTVNLTNVFFILGGAFTQATADKKKSIGETEFGFVSGDNTNKTKSYLLETEDLIKAGLIPEIVGRIGNIVQVNSLTREDYYNILYKNSNSILNNYELSSLYFKISPKIPKNILNDLLDEAVKLNLGARGLKKVVDKYFIDKMKKKIYTK